MLKSEGKEYEPPDPFKAELSAHIRIGDNGAGCITFKLSISEKKEQANKEKQEGKTVTLRRLDHMLSLSQRYYERQNGISKLKFSEEKSPFIESIKKYKDKEEPKIYDKYLKSQEDSGSLLFHIFAAALEAMEQEINHPPDETDTKKTEIVKIQDKSLMNFEDENLVAQNPYVLSVIELKGAEDEALFWQDISQEDITRNEYKELGAILFRMVYPDWQLKYNLRETIRGIRIPYELRSTGGLLKNYAWDSNILMCFSRVSSLFACRAGTKDQPPASFIRKTLLDSLEILRARWHMSILINALLDQEITMMKTKKSSECNRYLLENLIERRRQFAYFLDDPLPYNYEGSSVTQIIAEAEEEMWISKLRSMTFQKLEVLDKLYQDQMQFIQMSEFDAFDNKIEEYRKRMRK